MSIPATKLKERFGDSRKRRPNKLETKPSRLHRTLTFAAHHPERCQGLVLYGAFAKFTSWFPTDEALEGLFQYIDTAWGSGESLPMFAPSMVGDAAFQQWWGKFERLGANPGAATEIMRMNSEIDITDVLPTIRVPTLVLHRTEDVNVDVIGGRMLADLIPNARLLEYPGSDHILFVGESGDEITSAIETFVTGSTSAPRLDRVKSEMCWIICLDAAPPRWVSRGRFVPRILRSVRL